MKPCAQKKIAPNGKSSKAPAKPVPASVSSNELDKIVKAANDVIRIQNTSIAKYVKAQAVKEKAQAAQFQNHINFFQHIVMILTQDDTTVLPNGKKLVDEDKRARCLAQVKAYADGCMAKEAALKASEETFELKAMPEIDLWTDYGDDEEEEVTVSDLFDEVDEGGMATKKARV
jgi:hypothetical protein